MRIVSIDQAAKLPKIAPLTVEAVAAVIEGFVQLQVALIPSKHFQQRGRRRGISIQDAQWILTTGRVTGNPEWNERFGDWTYEVRGADMEGADIVLRIGISPNRSTIVLVTTYEPSR